MYGYQGLISSNHFFIVLHCKVQLVFWLGFQLIILCFCLFSSSDSAVLWWMDFQTNWNIVNYFFYTNHAIHLDLFTSYSWGYALSSLFDRKHWMRVIFISIYKYRSLTFYCLLYFQPRKIDFCFAFGHGLGLRRSRYHYLKLRRRGCQTSCLWWSWVLLWLVSPHHACFCSPPSCPVQICLNSSHAIPLASSILLFSIIKLANT